MNYQLKNQIIDSEETGLSFEGNGATWNTAEDVKNVTAALGQNVVHYLKISGNTLGVNAAAAIGEAMEKHPEFRKALWKGIFTGCLIAEVPLALKHLAQGLIKAAAQLTILDLSDNSLGVFGMTGLEEFLWSPVCYTLQELYLNNCGLGLLGSRMLSAAVRRCHEKSIIDGIPLQLKVFVAGGNCLENEGTKAISEMLRDLRTLEVIALPNNSIHQLGLKVLSESISCNRNLRVLNLNNNVITREGVSYLAKAISNTLLLQDLDLSDCMLKTDEAISLAKVLEKNHLHLEVVNLSSNEINKNGDLIIATAMKNNPSLKKLMLNGNKFDSAGVNNIAKEVESAVNFAALTDILDNQNECDENDATSAYGAADTCENCIDSVDIAADGYGDTTKYHNCLTVDPNGVSNGAANDNVKHKAVKDCTDMYANKGNIDEHSTKRKAYTIRV